MLSSSAQNTILDTRVPYMSFLFFGQVLNKLHLPYTADTTVLVASIFFGHGAGSISGIISSDSMRVFFWLVSCSLHFTRIHVLELYFGDIQCDEYALSIKADILKGQLLTLTCCWGEFLLCAIDGSIPGSNNVLSPWIEQMDEWTRSFHPRILLFMYLMMDCS